MSTTSHEPLPADVIAAAQRGEKIEAIKILRERTGLGLKEAKDAVDAFADGHAPSFGTSHGASGGTSRVLVFLVLAIGLAAAAWFFFPAVRPQ